MQISHTIYGKVTDNDPRWVHRKGTVDYTIREFTISSQDGGRVNLYGGRFGSSSLFVAKVTVDELPGWVRDIVSKELANQ